VGLSIFQNMASQMAQNQFVAVGPGARLHWQCHLCPTDGYRPDGSGLSHGYFPEVSSLPPATWNQFAQDAAFLHAANPKLYIADFPPNNANLFEGLPGRQEGTGLAPRTMPGKSQSMIHDLAGRELLAEFD